MRPNFSVHYAPLLPWIHLVGSGPGLKSQLEPALAQCLQLANQQAYQWLILDFYCTDPLGSSLLEWLFTAWLPRAGKEGIRRVVLIHRQRQLPILSPLPLPVHTCARLSEAVHWLLAQ